MTRTEDRTDAYLPQLDGVRAIAVLMVVAQHWIANPLRMGAPLGFVGVTIFFVLSGYLISRILFQAKARQDRGEATVGQSLKIFYARRFLRIFPIYYLTIFVLWAAKDPYVLDSIGWLLTYTVNFHFLGGGFKATTGHLWTLAIEEQYYLVYPFIVLFFTARGRTWALWGMIALATISRVVMEMKGVRATDNKYFTLACFDSFAMGGLLAQRELTHGKEALRAFFRKPWVGVATAGLVVAFGALGVALGDKGSGRAVWFRTVVSVASLYVVGLALLEDRRLGKVLANPALVYIGKISYGIYLYHPFSHRLLELVFPGCEGWAHWRQVVAYSVVTMVVSTGSWYLIEKPVNGLKARFSYPKRR